MADPNEYDPDFDMASRAGTAQQDINKGGLGATAPD